MKSDVLGPPQGRGARDAWMLGWAAVALWLLDRSTMDTALASWFGGPQGFAQQHAFWAEGVMHQGARAVGWALALALALAVWKPWGPMRRLAPGARVQLALTVLLAALLVSIVKARNPAHCPWALSAYGGSEAFVSHWDWASAARGRCFPAGHASTGFAFLAGWWVFRDVDARVARRWLAAALAAGLVLGLVQQVRGAHFMSHTLWSAWVCAAVAALLAALWPTLQHRWRRAAEGRRLAARRAPMESPPAPGSWRPRSLMLLAAVWLAGLPNLPWWQALQGVGALSGGKGLGLAVGSFVALVGLLLALQALLAWKRVWKPAMVLLLMVAAGAGHYMLAYRVVIDPTMMVNVAQTDPREVRDLISLRMLATLLLAGVLPAAWLATRRVAWRPWPRQALSNLGLLALGLALAVAAVLAVFQPLASTMRNHKQLRYLLNPLNVVYSGLHVATAPLRIKDTRLRLQGQDAAFAPPAGAARPPLIVLVLGETARAANFPANGYGRPTTPQMSRLQAEGSLVSFSQVSSCGTSTAASVPCMFSLLGKEAFEATSAPHENVLDVLQRAGLAVLWVDNQAGCKGVCARVAQGHTEQMVKSPPAGVRMPEGVCDGSECLDEALLVGLEERIAALPAAARARGLVLVLHTMGNHGPAYFKRSPAAFKPFQPECRSVSLQDCPREQLINAYDNAIVYTDHVLGRLVQWLQARAGSHDAAMLYVSDHGESLGEGGLYLHGLPYAVAPEQQTHVPWLSWFSEGMRQRLGLDMACLARAGAQPLSHDHLSHSLLALAGVTTQDFKPHWDAFGACRKP